METQMTNLTETTENVASVEEGLFAGLLATLPTNADLVEAFVLLTSAALVTLGINFLL
jgi:hypothetical protein